MQLQATSHPVRVPRAASFVPVIQREIERMIGTGELTGGTRINESTLAVRLGISRGPVREACRALEQIGLLRSELNRGFFVREISTKEALDLYDIRAGLLGTAGRLAASIVTSTQLREMGELIARMDAAIEANDISAFYSLNNQFHSAVLYASDNEKLIEIYPLLEAELHLYRRRGFVLAGSMRSSNDEHKAIVDALSRSDGSGAARLLERHILSGKARFLRTLEDDTAVPARLSPLDPKTLKLTDR